MTERSLRLLPRRSEKRDRELVDSKHPRRLISLRRLGLEGCALRGGISGPNSRGRSSINSTWIRSPPKSSSLSVPLAPEED